MQYLFQSTALALTIFLVACGGGSPHAASANGSWSAVLAIPADPQPGTFTFNLTQNNTALSANSLNFSGMGNFSPCFGVGTTLSGSLGLAMMNGGAMTMTMFWTPPGGAATNTMAMQGNLTSDMTSGSGTFTLTGQTSGCVSQLGTFTMKRAPAHGMVAGG